MHPRLQPGEADRRSVRVRGGADATLVDYSRISLRVASPMRLSPGRRCTIVWPRLTGSPCVEGVVIRSCVGRVVPEQPVIYEAVVAFLAPWHVPWERPSRSE